MQVLLAAQEATKSSAGAFGAGISKHLLDGAKVSKHLLVLVLIECTPRLHLSFDPPNHRVPTRRRIARCRRVELRQEDACSHFERLLPATATVRELREILATWAGERR